MGDEADFQRKEMLRLCVWTVEAEGAETCRRIVTLPGIPDRSQLPRRPRFTLGVDQQAHYLGSETGRYPIMSA